MPRTKKPPKPTFDVALGPIADNRSGWVYRSDASAAQPAVPAVKKPRFEPGEAPQQPTRGWLASGLVLMALPMALGMTLMIAPVALILSVRSRQ